MLNYGYFAQKGSKTVLEGPRVSKRTLDGCIRRHQERAFERRELKGPKERLGRNFKRTLKKHLKGVYLGEKESEPYHVGVGTFYWVKQKIICILAVSIPMALSACIYLHITQGTGKEASLALTHLKIGLLFITIPPCLFLIVSVPFRYVVLHNFFGLRQEL